MLAIIKTEKGKTAFLKQLAKLLDAKIHFVKENDYEEEVANKLIEEGLKTPILSKNLLKEKFRKHGVGL